MSKFDPNRPISPSVYWLNDEGFLNKMWKIIDNW